MEMLVRFPGGARVDADYKGFTVRTDQPDQAGGESSAPAPFDLFLASLGTCAGVYVLNFLRGRGLSTEGVTLGLLTQKDSLRRRVSSIRIAVRLPQGFPERYREALRRAVDLCAVKQHVIDPPAFETEIEIGESRPTDGHAGIVTG